MLNNSQIAILLETMADVLEIESSKNYFRFRSYRMAADVLKNMSESVCLKIKNEEDLSKIKGIGKEIAEKIKIACQTGKIPQLEKMFQIYPESLVQLVKLPGLGPRRVRQLFDELEVQNISDLETVAKAGKIQNLDGFGEKTEAKILEGIPTFSTTEKRIPWFMADLIAKRFKKFLLEEDSIEKLEIAGSYRRKEKTVGDLDILTVSDFPEKVMKKATEFAEVISVLGSGKTKTSIIIEGGFQIDVRVVPSSSFGAALQYFTGSRNHNVWLRSKAQEQGLKINEYGVYRGEEKIAGENEEDIYLVVGEKWVNPEDRKG